MRITWLLVLAACGGGTEPRAGVTGSGSSAPSALSGARAPLTAPTVGPITGMHGAAIARIAVTDAGDAAVTADTTGAIRLWPALDGTREPVVVSGSPPHALDVAHDGDGFLIGNHMRVAGSVRVRGSRPSPRWMRSS